MRHVSFEQRQKKLSSTALTHQVSAFFAGSARAPRVCVQQEDSKDDAEGCSCREQASSVAASARPYCHWQPLFLQSEDQYTIVHSGVAIDCCGGFGAIGI